MRSAAGKQATTQRPYWVGHGIKRLKADDDKLRRLTNARADNSVKIRGCRVSAPIERPWGGTCRVIEWINTRGERSFLAVRVDATEQEIRERMRAHANGRRHVAMDAAALGRPKLRRA
ncbi:DUF2866 domain-containing protein [Caballeronia sp. LZ025]|uniref:DUF2866 domain-containing protein n=1 Tax=Caballeronia TaxID=1827195 RepID=UPI001FD10353|nr:MULTISPECIES: DUF2866 domain-containing protein [Caballeronia]MDR5733930.1 DUF2866 domain-containing protein [Caballeronia sp. LZ025]